MTCSIIYDAKQTSSTNNLNFTNVLGVVCTAMDMVSYGLNNKTGDKSTKGHAPQNQSIGSGYKPVTRIPSNYHSPQSSSSVLLNPTLLLLSAPQTSLLAAGTSSGSLIPPSHMNSGINNGGISQANRPELENVVQMLEEWVNAKISGYKKGPNQARQEYGKVLDHIEVWMLDMLKSDDTKGRPEGYDPLETEYYELSYRYSNMGNTELERKFEDLRVELSKLLGGESLSFIRNMAFVHTFKFMHKMKDLKWTLLKRIKIAEEDHIQSRVLGLAIHRFVSDWGKAKCRTHRIKAIKSMVENLQSEIVRKAPHYFPFEDGELINHTNKDVDLVGSEAEKLVNEIAERNKLTAFNDWCDWAHNEDDYLQDDTDDFDRGVEEGGSNEDNESVISSPFGNLGNTANKEVVESQQTRAKTVQSTEL